MGISVYMAVDGAMPGVDDKVYMQAPQAVSLYAGDANCKRLYVGIVERVFADKNLVLVSVPDDSEVQLEGDADGPWTVFMTPRTGVAGDGRVLVRGVHGSHVDFMEPPLSFDNAALLVRDGSPPWSKKTPAEVIADLKTVVDRATANTPSATKPTVQPWEILPLSEWLRRRFDEPPVTDEEIDKIRHACDYYGYGDNPFDAVAEVRRVLGERFVLLEGLERCDRGWCHHPRAEHLDGRCGVVVIWEGDAVHCQCESFVEPF